MKSVPEISVIVPVYNVEKWLPKCLDSILGQTYGDIELILVNDGSTDGSLEICRTYEANDKRIRVIDGPNRGSSAARNTGLELAQGKWIIFCDSDDWWDVQLLEKLHTTAVENDADISACDIVWEYIDKSVVEAYAYGPIETDVDKAFVGTVYCSLCNKLIKKELFVRYEIRGSHSTAMWDDVYITCQLRYFSRRTVIVAEQLYHYNRCVTTSQCIVNKDLYPKDQICVTHKLEQYFKSKGYYDTVSKNMILGCQLFIHKMYIGSILEWRNAFPRPIMAYNGLARLLNSKSECMRYIIKSCLPISFIALLYSIKHRKGKVKK